MWFKETKYLHWATSYNQKKKKQKKNKNKASERFDKLYALGGS